MKIVIIGMGNVGQHLAQKLLDEKQHLIQCYNRSRLNQKAIETANWAPLLITEWSAMNNEADLVILSVVDDAIRHVSEQLPDTLKKNAIIAHTSGIHGREVLCHSIQNRAIFYPLNSFTVGTAIDWKETPLFLTASDENLKILRQIAASLSENIYEVDEGQKAILHACAVMVNNFPNALFGMADTILKDKGMTLKPLLPLIKTTFDKIQQMSPAEAQTGPAIRADYYTIQKHLNLLEEYPEEQLIYKLLSKYINPESIEHEDR